MKVALVLALAAIGLGVVLWYVLTPRIERRTTANAIRGSVRPDVQRHIFGTEAHGLAPLVSELGSERAVITAIAQSLAELPESAFVDGEIVQTVVPVADAEVTVRGRKVDGVVQIATAFVHP